MEIGKHNNLAFKTNIRVVSPTRFQSVVKDMRTKAPLKEIIWWEIMPPKRFKYTSYATKIKNVFTQNIRTCTGVLIANKGKNASLFGHFDGTAENIKDINVLKPYMQGTNAVLIGSKPDFQYSRKLFNNVRDEIREKGIPTTLMKFMDKEYQANMFYTSDNDELLLSISNAFTDEFVKNMTDLEKVMSTIKISSKDTLTFDAEEKLNFWDRVKKLFK